MYMEINNLHLHRKTITNSGLEMDNSRLTFKTHLHYLVVKKKTFLNSAKYYLTGIIIVIMIVNINIDEYIRKSGIRLKIQHSLKSPSVIPYSPNIPFSYTILLLPLLWVFRLCWIFNLMPLLRMY